MLAACLVVASWSASQGADQAVDPQHPLAPALEHAYNARDAVSQVKDYQATFSKAELIGQKMLRTKAQLKLREEPYSVYMLFEAPHNGREVIYVAGRNNGKLVAHETGIKAIVGTVSLDPTSQSALEENRYPITMCGIRNMLDQLIQQWEGETRYGEVEVKYFPDARMGDLQCKVIETSHPRPRKQFKFQMSRLFIDKSSGLPVRLEQYAFTNDPQKPRLVEEYSYTNLQTNIGLRDSDFDQTNPNYAFPR